MKKRIILLLTFSLLFLMQHHEGKAQNITNGDFSVGQNTGQHYGCFYFDQGDVPNWFRSHGTPELRSGGRIGLHHGGINSSNSGEGIVGGYQFVPGMTYRIDIELSKKLYGSIDVYATSGIVQSPLATSAPQCISNHLSVSYSQSEFIGGEFMLNMSGNTISLTYSPTMANNQIWIYFSGFNGGGADFMEIDWVKIWTCTQGSKHYPLSIDPGLTDRQLITTGSGALPNATNVPNWTTTFIGANIQLNPWTEINVIEDGFFLAIGVADCAGPEEGDDGGGGGNSKPGRNSQGLLHFADQNQPYDDVNSVNAIATNQLSTNPLNIYPNPTTGSFNIEIPQRGNYTIRVMNILGSTVYEGKMADEQKKSILLDSNLPPGNYTLHISGDGLRHVERITLTK